MDGYVIHSKVVEYRVAFGRIFVHVNAAVRHRDRQNLSAIAAAIRDISTVPEEDREYELPFAYSLEVRDPKTNKRTLCTKIRVRFRRLDSFPETSIDSFFPHQKGGITPQDMVITELSFL